MDFLKSSLVSPTVFDTLFTHKLCFFKCLSFALSECGLINVCFSLNGKEQVQTHHTKVPK